MQASEKNREKAENILKMMLEVHIKMTSFYRNQPHIP